jgi:hypothetical protein
MVPAVLHRIIGRTLGRKNSGVGGDDELLLHHLLALALALPFLPPLQHQPQRRQPFRTTQPLQLSWRKQLPRNRRRTRRRHPLMIEEGDKAAVGGEIEATTRDPEETTMTAEEEAGVGRIRLVMDLPKTIDEETISLTVVTKRAIIRTTDRHRVRKGSQGETMRLPWKSRSPILDSPVPSPKTREVETCTKAYF